MGYMLFIWCIKNQTTLLQRKKTAWKCYAKVLKNLAMKIIDYEKKKQYRLLMKKKSLLKSKTFVIYAKKNLIQKKKNCKVKELLIIFVIKDKKYQERFL